MSTRMPVARNILLGKSAIVNKNATSIDGTIFDTRIAKNALKNGEAVLFDIAIANDLSRQGQGILEGREVIKPPYPMTWMEWEWPGAEYTQHAACLAVDTENVDVLYDELKNKLLLFFYVTIDNAPGWVNMACGYAAQLTKHGQLADVPNIIMAKGLEIQSGKLQETLESWIYHALCTVLLALSLINCKNVTTPENGSIGLARTGSEKRRKIPSRKVKYHTIMLPGGGSESDGKGGHRATAIHQVRGHFKTFTANKPLLGQHVGTYWWGWQVRGSAENGIVVSDYKVGVK